MKKFALILLSAILAISLVACASGGDEEESSSSASILDYMETSHTHKLPNGTLTFEDGDKNDAIISKYVGEHAKHAVEVPSEVGAAGSERKVSAIGKEAFYYCTSVTSVVIPEGVEYIGEYAFAGCTALKSITIPASVTTIAKGAFHGCTALEEIILANGFKLVKIEDFAFNDCSALKSITLPEGLTHIGTEAFRDCTSLTEIKTPTTLMMIGDMAFYNCDGIVSEGAIVLHENLKFIGDFAFGDISKSCISAPAGSYAEKYLGNDGVEDESTEETSAESTEGTSAESVEETTEEVTESTEETSAESTEETSAESTEETATEETEKENA